MTQRRRGKGADLCYLFTTSVNPGQLQSWSIARCDLVILLSCERLSAFFATTLACGKFLDRFRGNPCCGNRRECGDVNCRGSSAAPQPFLPRCKSIGPTPRGGKKGANHVGGAVHGHPTVARAEPHASGNRISHQ